MKRRNFLLALITAPFAAALAKVALPQNPCPPYLDYLFLTDQTENAGIQRRPGFAMGRQETPFSVEVNRIEVVERWTREGGIRRIGDGPWERIWGPAPVPYSAIWRVDGHRQCWLYLGTRRISPEERAAQTFAQGRR